MLNLIMFLFCFIICTALVSIPIYLIFTGLKIAILENDVKYNRDTDISIIDKIMTVFILISALILYFIIW